MPLLDHFHPPLSERRHWEGFHSRWAGALADMLNGEGLPENLFAEPAVHIGGQAQVDVATLESEPSATANGSRATATLTQPMKAVPVPTWIVPAVFLDSFEVKVFSTEAGPTLVAAIELVSPSNEDRPQTRRALAVKCASYLTQGIHLIIVDIVTNRAANLHNEIMNLMETTNFRLPPESKLYSVAYRPVRRESREEIDVWPATFGVGDRLPSLPLFVAADLSVLVDFDAAYQETCRKLRLSA
jgi:Protein of unknown function (DUF4058)